MREKLGVTATHLEPIIDALHDLFWPVQPQYGERLYRRDVTADEFIAACASVINTAGQ